LPGTRNSYAIENWKSLTDKQKIHRVEGFCGAKDSGTLDKTGELMGAAHQAYKLVSESGLY
jgi:hypothetical protein